jgi:uncharacterized membrane protein
MLASLWRILFRGLTVVLPIAATVYVLDWLVRGSESLLREAVILVVDEKYYVPGMGIAVLLLTLFLVGLLMYAWVARKLFEGFDKLFRRIPVVSTIYSPVRDLMDMVGGGFARQLGQPVMIQIPNTNIETLGFITRDNTDNLPDGLRRDDHVVVFVQWSSQVGGYCFIVPRKAVTKVDMSVEDGLRWALTGGLSGPKNGDDASGSGRAASADQS